MIGAPIMVAAATGEAGAAAVPTALNAPIALADFPPGAVRTGYVYIEDRITIAPTGAVTACKTVILNGAPDLGPLSCRLLQERAHYSPARDARGDLVNGVISVWFTVSDGKWLSAERNPKLSPDGIIHFHAGPNDPLSLDLDLVLQLDDHGRIQACNRRPDGGNSAQNKYLAAACGQIVDGTLPTALNAEGQPVRSVQTYRVQFVSDRWLEQSSRKR